MNRQNANPNAKTGNPAGLEGAMRSFAESFGAINALRVESCIHCGMCADACHFYIATEDAKYTPILKVEPLKQAYKREAGPMAWLFKALRLKRPVTAEQLDEWQHLLYDSCNMCGRCSLICPMGIDVAALMPDWHRRSCRSAPSISDEPAARSPATRTTRKKSAPSAPRRAWTFPSTRTRRT